MTKFKDAVVYFISIALVVLLMYFDLYENLFNDNYNINSLLQRLLSYVFLGIIIYTVVKGRMVSNNKTIIRNIILLLIGNFIIYSIIFFLTPNTKIENFFSDKSIIYFKWYFVYSVWASFIGAKIFHDYRQEINKNGYHRYVFWKFFIQAILYFLALYFVFVQLINPFIKQSVFYNELGNYIVIGVISAIFLGVFYFIDRKKNRLESEIIQQSTKAETATANFETLKNQLDPHFLFNSLNVLTGLIEENPDKAIDFTTSLSKIYRYLLEQKDKEVIPLRDEINFAKTYLKLLKLRFEDAIQFHFELMDFKENEYIVPLSLQIILENTIKHNIVSESKPLKITITKEDHHLVVKNNLQKKEALGHSTGVGLENIKKRYQLISDKIMEIEQSETYFQVKLPILTQKFKPMENQFYSEEQIYIEAKERVLALKKFYYSLAIYVIFSIFFIIINAVNFHGNWWCIWPIFGWGIAMLMKGIKLLTFNKDWEERKTKALIEQKKQVNKWQ